MAPDGGPGGSIYVLAGTNGAGKSSVGGAAFRARGANYFNPDEVTRRILEVLPHLGLDEANALAWQEGKRELEEAVRRGLNHAFETTLGGNTIAGLLHEAIDRGIEVRVWYMALATPELHIDRVRRRVARGGHDIPEAKIRERYDRSRENLVRLLPRLTELRLFDNSREADPASGHAPEPLLVLHTERGRVRSMCAPADVPEWAKPIVARALGR